MFPRKDERYEDGCGDVSGDGGHKRLVSWNSRFAKDDVKDVADALQDQHDRLNGK